MQAAHAEKLVRKQILIFPRQVERLDQLAAAEGVSVAEMIRQAIDAFEPAMTEVAGMKSSELMEFVSAQLKEAIASTHKANQTVAAALKKLSPTRKQ